MFLWEFIATGGKMNASDIHRHSGTDRQSEIFMAEALCLNTNTQLYKYTDGDILILFMCVF